MRSRNINEMERTGLLFMPRVCLSILLLIGLNATSAFGQNTTAARPDRGANPGGSYAVSDIESTNLQNGNVSLSIPLASLPPIAGGKLSLTISAHYNSKLWNMTREEVLAQELPSYQTYVRDTPQQSDRGGWLIGGGYSIIFRDARDDFNYLVPPYEREPAEWQRLSQYNWKKAILLTPDGAEHELRPQDPSVAYSGIGLPRDYLRMFYRDTPASTGQPMRYATLDGTYLSALINPGASSDPVGWTIFMPDGTRVIQYKNGIQRIKDSNGNSIKIFGTAENGVATTHYQDEQTGREIKLTSNYSNDYLQYQVWYQLVGGAWAHTDINFGETLVTGKVYSVNGWNPNFRSETGDTQGIPCRHEQMLQLSLPVVRSIVYPQTEPGVDGRRFTFSYNSDTTQTDTTNRMRWQCGLPETYARTVSYGMGSLSRIVMPTGAVVDYTYSNDGVHDFIGPLPNFPTQEDEIAREVLKTKKVTHDNNVIEQWTYNIPTSGYATVSSVTNPDGSGTTELYYSTDPRFNQVMSGSETAGMGGLVYRTLQEGQSTDRRWVLLSPNGQGISGTGVPGEVLVTMNPVVAAEYTTISDANNVAVKMNARTYQHDLNGNVTQIKEYDWFDPAQVTRDAHGVPTAVPAGATLLRVANTSYHNSVDASSTHLYRNRTLNSGTPLFLNAPKETSAGERVMRFSYDSQAYGAPPTAGNVTSVGNLANRGDTNPANDVWITVSKTYGAYGNVSSVTDGRGKITNFFYDDTTHAAPTRVVVDPENGTGTQTTTTAYDYSRGLVTSVTDPNNKTSEIDYTNQLLGTADPFGRPGVQVSPPVTVNGVSQQRHVKTVYHDAARKVTVTSDLNAENDGLLKSETFYDQLGRTTESRQFDTPMTHVRVRQKYDSMGRVSQVSNPYRAAQTPVWTTTIYDLSGRVTSVTTPDNAAVTTSYDGSFMTVTDQAGKVRRSYTDGLGRLARVDEPDVNGNLGTTAAPAQPTSYTYDASGNLRKVEQGGQQRYFMYDSLGRLLRVKNPEQGVSASLNMTDPVTGNSGWSLGYSYDANGNLTGRTDARGVVSVNGYDSLNRNTTVDYQNTPADPANTINPDIARSYDGATLGKGRFWYDYQGGNHSVGARVEHRKVDTYDALGRPLSQRQMFKTDGAWSAEYTTGRTYHLTGSVQTQTYPSGHTVSYTQDAAGRTAGFTGNLGDGVSRAYATGMSYDESSRLSREQFGTQTALHHKRHYNLRGQLNDVRLASTPDEWAWNRGAFIAYYDSGYHWSNTGGQDSGPDNNGNVTRAQSWVPGDDAVSTHSLSDDYYSYDSLNRISSTSEYKSGTGVPNSHVFTQAFTYDRWGNRTIKQADTTQTLAPEMRKAFTVDTATNRLGVPGGQTGVMSYDEAGNLTNDSYTGAGERAYDAENRMTSAGIGINSNADYTYDADGRRVRRQTPNENVWQVYGLDGELLAEYAAGAAFSNPQKEYGYRNGELLVIGERGAGAGGSGTNTAANASSFVRQTVPAEMVAGRRYQVSVTMKNTGSQSWSSATNHNLGSQSPQDNWTWGTHRASLPTGTTVLPGGEATYNFTVTAPSAPGTYNFQWRTAQDTVEWFGASSTATSVTVSPAPAIADESEFVSQSVPTVMQAGHTYNASATMRNTGTSTWTSANYGYNLGSVNPQDNWTWGRHRANLPAGASVAPGDEYTYNFTVTAPSVPGTYNFQWRTVHDGVAWFGNHTPNVAVNVSGAMLQDGATFVSQTVPTAMQPGQRYEVSVRMKNTGTSSWTASNLYNLGAQSPYDNYTWGMHRVALPSGTTVAPGNEVTFSFTVTAPSTPGTYNFGWRTVHDGVAWFGDATPNVVVNVTGGTNTGSGGVQWLISDHLGTPRMIADLTGSLAGIKRHDYLPFGEEIGAGVGNRTQSQGYSQLDGMRQKFAGSERDDETGLDYMKARYYANYQGRFTGVDPIGVTKYHITNPQLWNGYAYALNNPLVMIDPDGRFPWCIHIRSFIYTSTVGGGLYSGDGRGPSLSTNPREASSRVRLNFTLDYDSGRVTSYSVKSDSSVFYGIPGAIGPRIKEGSPGVQFSNVETYHRSKSVGVHYWGADPIPGIVTPNLDIHANIAIAESIRKDGTGTLFVAGTFTGDQFPSTEAFIVDQSGRKVFLGAKHEEGGVGDLYGDNKQDLFKVDLQLRFDKRGNFTAVMHGGKTYTVEQWNKKVRREF